MKNFWPKALLIICLFKTTSAYAHDAPAIFACLIGPDYECLNREIGRNQEWYKLKNNKKKTPLRVALDKKNISLVTHLLDKGAKVNNNDVIHAMKILYQVPKEYFLNKNIHEKTAGSHLCRRLILATQNTEGKKLDNMALLGQSLNLFCKREEIALEISDLFSQKILSDTESRILLYEIKDVFLYDKPLSAEEMRIVVIALLPLPAPHLLLRFIINMSKRSHLVVPKFITCSSRNTASKVPMAEELAQAIMENSRTRFIKVPPHVLHRHILQENGESEVNTAIGATNALSTFVLLSIRICTEDDEIQRRYLFWFAVYDILTQEGDFMGAFAVASALNSSETQRKLRSKIYKEIKLLEPAKNYKNYREARAKFENKFYIPALQVNLHDLTMASNHSLLTKVEDHEEIDESLLQFYALFNKEMSRAYLEAFNRKYPPKVIAELFNNLLLIIDEPHPDNQKLHEVINLIWPKPTIRRRSVTIF